MKAFVATILFSISLFSQANVMDDMTQNLRSTLETELAEFDGEVSSLKCHNTFVGIVCPGTLTFDNSKCEETYYYLGFGEKVYQRLCSTCWFNEGSDIYKPSCK